MSSPSIFYRLTALWILCEAMLGGIIHGFKIPVSGLVVGSCAIMCICLLKWYCPERGSILKATIIVAIFKMTLSPHSPFPAYIAVFFQGLAGELILSRRFYKSSVCFFSLLALLESALQRVLVMVIVFGNDIWKAINIFINGLTHEKEITNYSLYFVTVYVAIHIIVALIVANIASRLPQKINKWKLNEKFIINESGKTETIKRDAKKKGKGFLFFLWIVLLLLWIQSFMGPGNPLLSGGMALKMIVRSILIVLSWYFIAGPFLTKAVRKFLTGKQNTLKNELTIIAEILPKLKFLIAKSWEKSAAARGISRLKLFIKYTLVNSLSNE
jgi:hypothetical protein